MKATDECYLDSNVLIYFTDRNSLLHEESLELLQRLLQAEMTIIISSLCLDEFLYSWIKIFRSKKIANYHNELQKLLKLVLEIPNLVIKNPPLDKDANSRIVNLMKKFHLSPRDAYHLLTIQEHKITQFATFDNDFEKVFRRKVISHLRI